MGLGHATCTVPWSTPAQYAVPPPYSPHAVHCRYTPTGTVCSGADGSCLLCAVYHSEVCVLFTCLSDLHGTLWCLVWVVIRTLTLAHYHCHCSILWRMHLDYMLLMDLHSCLSLACEHMCICIHTMHTHTHTHTQTHAHTHTRTHTHTHTHTNGLIPLLPILSSICYKRSTNTKIFPDEQFGLVYQGGKC